MENSFTRVNVAIIGLGRVGSAFISKLADLKNRGITIVAAAEKNSKSPGIVAAESKGIKVFDSEKSILDMREKIDVVFELTGDRLVERNMRLSQVKSGNTHTVIVPRIVALMIWNLISDDILPDHTNPTV